MNLIDEDYLNCFLRIPKSFFKLRNEFAIISIEKGTDTRNFVSKIMEYANKHKKLEIFDDDDFQALNLENEKLIQYFVSESKILL